MKPLISYLMLNIVGRLNWTGVKYFFTGREFDLVDDDIEKVCDLLLSGRYVGLCWRKTHFTSYLIALGHLLLTGRWSAWSHCWINIDDEMENPFRMTIFESISEGSKKSRFWNVLNCDAVVLLKPKFLKESDWDEINLAMFNSIGLEYDVFCDEADGSKVNCVEWVVSKMLETDENSLPGTRALMEKTNSLTPQMLYESGDFEIALEIRR